MNLSDLCNRVKLTSGLEGEWLYFKEAVVSGISYDSRHVTPGEIYVAIAGTKQDGHNFLSQAIDGGAVAALVERPLPLSFPQWVVRDSREALGYLAAAFYDYPTQSLHLTGITGTNGKTTISYLLTFFLEKAGRGAGRIGTTGAIWAGLEKSSPLTTPEAPQLQSWFQEMVKERVTNCVMEVSSHALALSRVTGCSFDQAIFTNLTHDHLDFHHTMEAYFQEKVKLFQMMAQNGPHGGTAIINIHDPWGSKLQHLVAGKSQTITYGISSQADVRGSDIQTSLSGSQFLLTWNGTERKVVSPLVGDYNVENVLAAITAGLAIGLSLDEMINALPDFPGVPGRFERIEAGQPFSVIVDYAHSPDALRKLLETVRPLTEGRLLLVFGCPGERDREKRPVMGEMACNLADWVMITTDDPHHEEPWVIIEEIVAGAERSPHQAKQFRTEVDRKRAIEITLREASAGDVVVLAGRGHETFQDVKGVRVPIDDRAVARAYLTSTPSHR